MRFRPCIDLHEGKVKQIVGSSLSDTADGRLQTNFETDRSAADYARLYRNDRLPGGHVIMLGPGNETAAREALAAFPGGLQIGGGITVENASGYLQAGASHVIVTSFVFSDGVLHRERLRKLVETVGSKRLVLDLSCKRVGSTYRIATDRWQKISELELDAVLLGSLAESCDEFLVHAADVEGKQGGIDRELVELLGKESPISATYAGGIRSLDDLQEVYEAGCGRVDATVGSALDIFGGGLEYDAVVKWHRKLG